MTVKWEFNVKARNQWRKQTPEAQEGDRQPQYGDYPCGSVVCPSNSRVDIKGAKCAKCRERYKKREKRALAKLKRRPANNERIYQATPWVEMSEEELENNALIAKNARREKRQLEAGMTVEEVYGDRLA